MKQEIMLHGRDASLLELSVFTELGRGPLSAGALTQRLSLPPGPAQQFFDRLVELGLLERRGVLYGSVWDVDQALEPLGEMSHNRGLRSFLPPIATVLALFLAFIAFQQWTGPRPQRTQPQTAPSASVLSSGATPGTSPVIPEERYLYYLVSTQQQADAADTLLRATERNTTPLRGAVPNHTVVAVASPESEARLRQSIDDANRQMEADSEEIRFRIVDLRLPN